MDISLEKLKNEIDQTSWSELEVHVKRSGLLLVDKTLDLAAVAFKVATDDVQPIKEWMDSSLIKRPLEDEIAHFKKSPLDKQFSFLIIQPYVLAQIRQ